MLMRWLAALPKESNIHKIMVFLVPKVALVDQQSEALVANTSLRVRPYRGDMGAFVLEAPPDIGFLYRQRLTHCERGVRFHRRRVLGPRKMDQRVRRH